MPNGSGDSQAAVGVVEEMRRQAGAGICADAGNPVGADAGNSVGADAANRSGADGGGYADTLRERLQRVRALRGAIVDHLDDVAKAVQADAGKVRAEALTTDILPTLEQLRYNERIARKVLGRRKRKRSLIFPLARPHVEYQPYGVVLIISP